MYITLNQLKPEKLLISVKIKNDIITKDIFTAPQIIKTLSYAYHHDIGVYDLYCLFHKTQIQGGVYSAESIIRFLLPFSSANHSAAFNIRNFLLDEINF